MPKQWAASASSVNRNLKELWGRDSSGVNRKVFQINATPTGTPYSDWMYGDESWSGAPSFKFNASGLTISGTMSHNGHGTGDSPDEDILQMYVPISLSSALPFVVNKPGLKVNTAFNLGNGGAHNTYMALWNMTTGADLITNYISSTTTVSAGTVALVYAATTTQLVTLYFEREFSHSHDDDSTSGISIVIPNGALSIFTGANGTDESPIMFA